MKAALSLMVALVAWLAAADVPVRVIDQGAQSGIEEPLRQVVSAPAEFQALWQRHSPRPVPTVDFARESVVAIFLGTRRTAGYSVEIVSVTESSSETVVRYRERTPAADAITAQVLTFPYVVASVPRATTPVRFESVR